jgi:putative flippase GtrA/4-amino-4-deoxy-L-arabinose transferase-like glycosyltransferase
MRTDELLKSSENPRGRNDDAAIASSTGELPSVMPRFLLMVNRVTGGRLDWVVRFFSYSLVGGAAAVVNLLCFSLLYYKAPIDFGTGALAESLHYIVVFALATEISVIFNFMINDRVTFGKLPGHARSWILRCLRFHLTTLVGTLITFVVSFALAHIGLLAVLAQMVAIGVAFLVNFTLHHVFTYSHLHAHAAGEQNGYVATNGRVATEEDLAPGKSSPDIYATDTLRLRRTTRSAPSLKISLDVLVGLALALVALLLCMHNLGSVSIWYDEAWSYGLSLQPLQVMMKYIWGPFQNMTLYYFILHFWLIALQRVGVYPTEFLFRLPSALCAAASVTFVYLIGARFFTRFAAIAASLFYMMHSLLLRSAQQARSYGLELLLVCAGWYALLRAITAVSRSAKWAWWSAFALLMALAVYAHLFSLLTFIAQFCGVALLLVFPNPWRENIRRSKFIILGSFFAAAALMLPILIDATLNGGKSNWVPLPTPEIAYSTAQNIMGGNPAWLLTLALVCCAALIGLMASIPAVNRLKVELPILLTRARSFAFFSRPGVGVALLLCWMCIPFLLAYALSLKPANLHLFYIRYLGGIVPALALLVGVGITSIRPRLARVVLLVAVVWLSFNALPNYFDKAQSQDFRTPMAWVQAHYQNNDGLACAPALDCSLAVDYYLDARPGPAHFDANSPGIFNWHGNYAAPVSVEAVGKYAATHQRLFFVTLHWTPGTPLNTDAQQDVDWLNSHYPLVDSYKTSTVEVYLYDTSSIIDPTT